MFSFNVELKQEGTQSFMFTSQVALELFQIIGRRGRFLTPYPLQWWVDCLTGDPLSLGNTELVTRIWYTDTTWRAPQVDAQECTGSEVCTYKKFAHLMDRHPTSFDRAVAQTYISVPYRLGKMKTSLGLYSFISLHVLSLKNNKSHIAQFSEISG